MRDVAMQFERALCEATSQAPVIEEDIELCLETLPDDERDFLLSREILTTAVGVNAQAPPVDGSRSRASVAGRWFQTPAFNGSHRIDGNGGGGSRCHSTVLPSCTPEL